MAQALLTAVFIGLTGLVATSVLGLRGMDISRHISYGIFSTLVTLALMPTIYAVLDDWRENVRRLFRQARAPRAKPGAIEATAAAIVPE